MPYLLKQAGKEGFEGLHKIMCRPGLDWSRWIARVPRPSLLGLRTLSKLSTVFLPPPHPPLPTNSINNPNAYHTAEPRSTQSPHAFHPSSSTTSRPCRVSIPCACSRRSSSVVLVLERLLRKTLTELDHQDLNRGSDSMTKISHDNSHLVIFGTGRPDILLPTLW